MPITNFGKNFQKLLKDRLDTWKLAHQALQTWNDARLTATGDAHTRRLVRMEEVVKMLLEEVVETVERAEQESV